MTEDNEKPAALPFTKPLFVYLKGTKVPLKELREAGYVPVPVDDLDGFKIVQSMFANDKADDLRDMVVKVLNASGSTVLREKFGDAVLKMLAANINARV